MSKIKEQAIDEHRAVVTTEAAPLVPRPTQTKNAFEANANEVAPETIVGELLKFSKGDLVAGKDNHPVPFGIRYIANMDAMLGGWVKWKAGKPVAHALVRIADGRLPPERETLGDLDEDAWEVDTDGRPRNPSIATGLNRGRSSQCAGHYGASGPRGDRVRRHFRCWHKADIRGIAAIWSLLDKSGHAMRRLAQVNAADRLPRAAHGVTDHVASIDPFQYIPAHGATAAICIGLSIVVDRQRGRHAATR